MKQTTQTTKDSQPRSPNVSFDVTKNNGAWSDSEDITFLILKDHIPLKAFIKVLKTEDGDRKSKGQPFEEFAYHLTCHARTEEETLYVAMKNFGDLKVPSFEGDTEHAMADQLVQEINATADDNEWLAKVKVLAESVEHHIDEEEESMLKKVEKTMPEGQRANLGAEYTRLMDEYRTLFEVEVPKNVRFKAAARQPVTHL